MTPSGPQRSDRDSGPSHGELSVAVEGFKQAEEALARIAADAGRLTSLGGEVESARAALAAAGEDLKVVAGALMGLTSAHHELVNQLGSAAAALQRPEGADSGMALERLDQALAAVPTTAQFDELANDLGALATRLESLATVDDMQDMATRLEALDDLASAAKSLADQPRPPTVAEVAEEVIRRADARSKRLHTLVMTEGIAFLILAAVIAVAFALAR